MARAAAPAPFDCMINGAGYMLVTSGQDLAWDEHRVAEIEQNLPLRQEDIQYTLTPPRVETPYAVTDLSGGIGYPRQDVDHRDGYDGAWNVDCSSGLPIKGPTVTTQQTLTYTSGGMPQFIEFNSYLYAATGSHLYRRDNDTGTGWTLVKDYSGATIKIVGKMAVFRGTQSAAFLFIPLSLGNYDVMSTAEAFTTHASQAAQGFEVVNDELWLHNTESNQQVIRKATDGGTAATWGGATVISDGRYRISELICCNGRLLVLKDDGLYGPTIQDESVIDRELTPEIKYFVSTYAVSVGGLSGQARATVLNGEVYWTIAGHVFAYNPDTGELRHLTPTFGSSATFRFYANPVSAIAAQPGIGLWATAYCTIDATVNGTASSGDGHVFRFGGWAPSREPGGDSARNYRAVWHGVIGLLSASHGIVRALRVTYAASSNDSPRLYAFVGGDIIWMQLADSQVPGDDKDYSVTASDGFVLYPWYTLNTPMETKVLRRVGLGGWNLSSDRLLNAAYRTTVAANFTSIGDVTSDPGSTVAVSGTPSSKTFQFRVKIAGATGTTFGQLASFVAYAAVRSQPYKEVIAQIKTSDNVRDRAGGPAKRSGSDLRTALETAIDGNPMTVIAPSGESMTMLGLDYAHQFEGWDSTGVARYRTTIRMVEAT